MRIYLLGALLLTVTPSWALLPFTATPAEQAMCDAKVNARLDRSDLNSGHMHHYCDGLRFIDRAYAAMGNKSDMEFYLKNSIGGFDYVLRNTQETYAMRGEVHFGRARALKLMGRNAEAFADLYKALDYKYEVPEVYQALGDHYLDAGNKKKALEVVTEGLKRNPNSRGLKRRYTELGGKLPYPEAVAGTIPTEPANNVAKPEQNSVSGESSVGATRAIPDPEKPATVEPSSQAESAKIGTPKNPYCRFCPD